MFNRLKSFFCRGSSGRSQSGRVVRANDWIYNKAFNYANNRIRTAKYTPLTFLPINLFEQFHRLANFYFLCLVVVQACPVLSPVPYYTTLLPLLFVLSVSAVKDGYDDYKRYISDGKINNRKSVVLRDGDLVEDTWKNIRVGDILYLESDEHVTADLLILSSSERHGYVFIETAELDGETNLKARNAVQETHFFDQNIEILGAFDGEVECEAPNNNLNEFPGNVRWEGKVIAIGVENTVLRGCILRNCRWMFGLVIFAGKDTKIMQNSGSVTLKTTHVDKLMNIIIICIVIMLLIMGLVCGVCSAVWESMSSLNYSIAYAPMREEFLTNISEDFWRIMVLSIIRTFSYIILLNTLIPISLYVSLEVIRLAHSLLINADLEMYHPPRDVAAHSNTTTLTEELGQVQYVFTDKTGTLTRNEMVFRYCEIKGIVYGEPAEMHLHPENADFSWNPYYDPKFKFTDGRLVNRTRNRRAEDPEARDFWLCLALCHTVLAEEVNGVGIGYKAQSPDEGALVEAARNFGYAFYKRSPSELVIIDVHDNFREVRFKLIGILEFTSERKRMSVVVKDENGVAMIYTKGADNVIAERLRPDMNSLWWSMAVTHLQNFAGEGLRTLCLACRVIPEEEFNQWNKIYEDAKVNYLQKEDLLTKAYELIEVKLDYLGITAVEDKLQEGVPECLSNIRAAGIKVWVLTGDKTDTAINIAYSCGLLSDEVMQHGLLDIDSETVMEQEMLKIRQKMCVSANENVTLTSKVPLPKTGFSFIPLPTLTDRAETTTEDTQHALIVDGLSFGCALKNEDRMNMFAELACRCTTVICCRVAPLQKAQAVMLVKSSQHAVTLAIGDGGNDVSMIKMANIGIGVSGHEGNQAVLSSDFSIGQFRFLGRLLFVHGRWSYLRMVTYLRYFFLKNFAFTLCHFWMAFFCGFTGQPALTDDFIALYNMTHTSLPCLALAIFNQDVSVKSSESFPRLYTPGLCDLGFNPYVFSEAVFESFIVSSLIYFVTFFALAESSIADLHSFQVTVGTLVVVYVTLRCAIDSNYWTGYTYFVVFGSIIWFFTFTGFYQSTPLFGIENLGTAEAVWSDVSFWCSLLLLIVLTIVPLFAFRFVQLVFAPTLSDRIKLGERLLISSSEDASWLQKAFLLCYRCFDNHTSRRRALGDSQTPSREATRPIFSPQQRPTSSHQGISRLARRPSRRTSYAFSSTPGFEKLLRGGRLVRDHVQSSGDFIDKIRKNFSANNSNLGQRSTYNLNGDNPHLDVTDVVASISEFEMSPLSDASSRRTRTLDTQKF